MAKLDGLKESLNNVRIIMGFLILLIIALTSGIIKRFDNKIIDIFFWSGFIIDIAFIITVFALFKSMIRLTKEIKYTKEK